MKMNVKNGKNIVILSDGTGNSPTSPAATNVWRIYQALDLSSHSQVAMYDDGVGSSSFWILAKIQGAIGWGVKKNVKDLYTFLCRTYEPGDDLFMFGFSRGAYTIRLIITVIHEVGIITDFDSERDLQRKVDSAYRTFRKSYRLSPLDKIRGWFENWHKKRHEPQSREWFDKKLHATQVDEIKFLGLWDSVMAHGPPFKPLKEALDYWHQMTPANGTMTHLVKKGCHALSIDESRDSFSPFMWNEWEYWHEGGGKPQSQEAKNLCEERISQVWFAGVHANLGGGYPDDSLSFLPLHWIMEQAERKCLKYKSGALNEIKERANPNGKIYNSRSGLGALYRFQRRELSHEILDTSDKPTADKSEAYLKLDDLLINRGDSTGTFHHPKIHHSVFDRIGKKSSLYMPTNIPEDYAIVREDNSIDDLPEELQDGFIETKQTAAQRWNDQEKIRTLTLERRYIQYTKLALIVAFFVIISVGLVGWVNWQFALMASFVAGSGALIMYRLERTYAWKIAEAMGDIWKQAVRSKGASTGVLKNPMPHWIRYTLSSVGDVLNWSFKYLVTPLTIVLVPLVCIAAAGSAAYGAYRLVKLVWNL